MRASWHATSLTGPQVDSQAGAATSWHQGLVIVGSVGRGADSRAAVWLASAPGAPFAQMPIAGPSTPGSAMSSSPVSVTDGSVSMTRQRPHQPFGRCAELAEFLKPYRKDALDNHPWKHWADEASEAGDTAKRMPGGQSRWSQGKDLSWEPLRPELVVEVAYDHMQGDRFRHTAQFRRWRTDKKPSDCTYAQLEVVPPQELTAIFPQGR